jgi:hypothetical protein
MPKVDDWNAIGQAMVRLYDWLVNVKGKARTKGQIRHP